MGALRQSIEALSWRTRYALTGDRRSWCAHAWNTRHMLRWRIHVAIWDTVFEALGQRDHCRNVAEWWDRHSDRP